MPVRLDIADTTILLRGMMAGTSSPPFNNAQRHDDG